MDNILARVNESDTRQQPLENRIKISDFSIDAILNSSGSKKNSLKNIQDSDAQVVPISDSSVYDSSNLQHFPAIYKKDTEETSFSSELYPWLQCNRFKPPKLPRRRDFKRRHNAGRSPRIPFTSNQVAVLEEKFRQTRYLSGSEVSQISELLHLTEARVKIWFQNRRARERRENQAPTMPVLQLPVETTSHQHSDVTEQMMTTCVTSTSQSILGARTTLQQQLLNTGSGTQSDSLLRNLHLPFLLYDK